MRNSKLKHPHRSPASSDFSKSAFLPAIAFILIIYLAGCQSLTIPNEPIRFEPKGDTFVHDPVMIKEGDTYYLFCTGGGGRRGGIIPIRCSKDMINWQRCGYVFDQLPTWCTEQIPGTRGSWAPDISYFNGQYHLYYSISTFGRNNSAIGLATNTTLDPNSPDNKWIDHGMVVRSTAGQDDFNAIDANLVYEDKDSVWLCWGSFWGGIKMRQLDPQTGMFSTDNTTLYTLCARPRGSEHVTPPVEGAIEAPFIIKHGKWWYLFVSADFCCRGVNSTYNVIVGRSHDLTGPYLDQNGIDMAIGGGTQILAAATEKWHGVGHQAVFHDNNTDYLICHAYDAQFGRSYLQISTIVWKEDWPVVAPMP